MRRLALTFVALFVLVGTTRADEENVPLDKVPKPVVETVKKRFPKAELVSASKEDEDGKTVYEVQIKDGGTKLDVTVTPEGTLLVIEKEIAAKDLPKAVTDALDAKYPKATFKVVEEITKVKDGKDQPVYYEVLLVTADKKTFEVELAADGKIIATEEKKEKKEEKKEEKKGEKGEDGELPKQLVKALKSKFPGAKVVDVDEEDEDGKTVYEVTLRYKTGTIEAVLTAKGEILKVKLKGKKGEDEDDKDEKKASSKKGKKGDDDDDKDEKGEKNQKGKNEKGQKNQKGDRD
jgi:uncharacterized membrane protein YkoI